MKKVILCLFFVALSSFSIAFGQSELKGKLNLLGYNFQYQEVGVYREAKGDAVLRMEYSESDIKNPENWRPAPNLAVYRVEVVYTKYPVDSANWQIPYQNLLQKRLNSLFAIDPSLKNNPKIEWRLVAQTGCRSIPQAKAMFHGIVLKYNPVVTQPTDLPEKTALTEPKQEKQTELTVAEKPEKTQTETTAEKTVLKRKTADELDPLDPSLAGDGGMLRVLEIIKDYKSFPDTNVIAALRRHPEWMDKVYVVDWTGSMYPYGAQVMAWHRLFLADSQAVVKQFYLFNDGDDAFREKYEPKIMGKTGGIYKGKPVTTNQILKLMSQAMSAGDGGEIPENNVEVLLEAQKEYPNEKFFIMIADNTAPVRDIELIAALKTPVHVIVCGNIDYIHPDFFTIAYRTGGTVVTQQKEFSFENKDSFQPGKHSFGMGDYQLEPSGFFQLLNPGLSGMHYSRGKVSLKTPPVEEKKKR